MKMHRNSVPSPLRNGSRVFGFPEKVISVKVYLDCSDEHYENSTQHL